MGSQCCHTDILPKDSVLQPNLELTKPKEEPLISPKKAIALKLKETSLEQICPEIITLAESIKTQQKFHGMRTVVQNCPIYYLHNMGCYYQGQWQEQLPHGCGVAVYKNRSYYQGEFSKGELHSQAGFYLAGTIQLPEKIQQAEEQLNPTYYIGGFEKSKFSGTGKMHHRGVIYEGEWAQGRRQGQGLEYTTKGSYTYRGSFSNGFKYGHGTYQCKINNEVYSYQGSFYCGLIHGRGELSVEHRICFTGYFLNGRAQGEGTLICDLGVLKCIFKKDRVSGAGEFVFNDQEKGKLLGEFKDEIAQSGQHQKVVRKVFCDGVEVTQAPFIDFRALMTDN